MVAVARYNRLLTLLFGGKCLFHITWTKKHVIKHVCIGKIPRHSELHNNSNYSAAVANGQCCSTIVFPLAGRRGEKNRAILLTVREKNRAGKTSE